MLTRSQALCWLLFVIAGSVGCAHRASGARLPVWYLTVDASYPASQYAVGRAACGVEIAAGERLSCAIERATEEALLQVRAHVASYRDRSCKLVVTHAQSEDGVSSSAESVCSSQLSGHSEASLDVTNAAPREQTCDATACYALVALSRAELASNLEQGIAAQRASFDQLLALAQTTDLLSGLSLLGQAAMLVQPLGEADVLMAALRGGAALSANPGARLARARNARLLGTSACLRTSANGSPEAERVFASVSALLSEQGVGTVQLDSVCRTGSLLIDYTSRSGSSPAAEPSASGSGLWTVHYEGRVRVSTPDGAVSRECEVQGRGVARSVETARRDAEDRLGAAVRDALAGLILGHAA
jgi:hypothetical protein